MKKLSPLILAIFFTLFFSTTAFSAACTVKLQNTEIVNSEFYIDFTTVVENIFIQHGYHISTNNNERSLFQAKHFITTGTNYLKLKQVNIEFLFQGIHMNVKVHELKNCLTVSCASSHYLKALKNALKKFDKQLPSCQR